MSPRSWWRRLGHGALLLLATVYCVFPIYFMLVQSLKTAQEDVFGNPLIVTNPTLAVTRTRRAHRIAERLTPVAAVA